MEIRNKLGLKPGAVVTFEVTKNGALLRKGGAGPHPVDQVYRSLNLTRRTDALLNEFRGPAPTKRMC